MKYSLKHYTALLTLTPSTWARPAKQECIATVYKLEPMPTGLSTAETTSVDASVPECNSTCVHRLLYHTGYSSAAIGIKQATEAYSALDYITQNDVVKEAIDMAIPAIASEAMTTVPVDYGHCDFACLLSSMDNVSRNATLVAIEWSLSHFHEAHVEPQNDTTLEQIRQAVWYVNQQDHLDVDSNQLDCEVMFQDPNETPSKQSDDNDKDKALALGLPWLAAGPVLGSSFALGRACYLDPVLCEDRVLDFVARFMVTAKRFLPLDNLLRWIMEDGAASTLVSDGGSISTSSSVSLRRLFNGNREKAPVREWSEEEIEDWLDNLPEDGKFERLSKVKFPPSTLRSRKGGHLEEIPEEPVVDAPVDTPMPDDDVSEPQLPKVKPWDEEETYENPPNDDVLEPPTESPLPSIEELLKELLPSPPPPPPAVPLPALPPSIVPSHDFEDDFDDEDSHHNEPTHLMEYHNAALPSTFATLHGSTMPTPATFTALPKPQMSVSMSSASPSRSKSTAMIPNLPPNCQNNGDYLSQWEALEALDHKTRKDCDSAISGLDQLSKQLWANSTSPPYCMLDPEGEWRTPQGQKLVGSGDSCNFTIRLLTTEERDAWVDAMLLERCPGGKHQSKDCKKIYDKLKKIAKI